MPGSRADGISGGLHTFRIRVSRGRVLLPATALLLLTLAGCEEDVTAVLGESRPFSIYGYIDPRADTQWVAVFPIEDHLEPYSPEPLEAAFTSRAQGADTPIVWRDSTFRYEDDTYGHIFYAPFRAEYGQAYHIEVQNASGNASTVTVKVPPTSDFHEDEPIVREGSFGTDVIVPVRLVGDIPKPLELVVDYLVQFDTASVLHETVISIPYTDAAKPAAEGWTFNVNLATDYTTVLRELIHRGVYRQGYGIVLHTMTARTFVTNENWIPPGGVFDPDVLAQPGVFDNVENGFGFVGSGYLLRGLITPQRHYIRMTNFRTFG